jgi:hypothetical protein
MAELPELRRALVELHMELLQAQRVKAERFGGRMSASETLQAATEDLRFAWLRTLSEVIADLDSGPADEPGWEDAVVERVRELLAPPDPETPFGRQYLLALQDHPEVVMAHAAVVSALDR